MTVDPALERIAEAPGPQCPEACCTPDDPTPEWMHPSGKCPYAATEVTDE